MQNLIQKKQNSSLHLCVTSAGISYSGAKTLKVPHLVLWHLGELWIRSLVLAASVCDEMKRKEKRSWIFYFFFQDPGRVLTQDPSACSQCCQQITAIKDAKYRIKGHSCSRHGLRSGWLTGLSNYQYHS